MELRDLAGELVDFADTTAFRGWPWSPSCVDEPSLASDLSMLAHPTTPASPPTRTGSLADVAELLGDSKRIAADHYVYALTDYREVDRTIALARA